MKDQVKESVKLVYPLRLVRKVAGISSAAWYRKPKRHKEKARRGPRVVITDPALLDEIRKEITQGHLIDEGYKKTWKRLKGRGIIDCKESVCRIMRENNLLPVTRPKPARKANEHKGSIKTGLPNRMWGTDRKRSFTRQDEWCWFFSVADHLNDKIPGWHVNKRGSRFDALEPVRMSVLKVFGSPEQRVCNGIGIFLRTDHGSQYDSHGLQRKRKFLGLQYARAFVRSPQSNGITERFHRTLDDQAPDLYEFESLEDARKIIGQFIQEYNQHWLIHRLGLTSPLEYREKHEKRRIYAA